MSAVSPLRRLVTEGGLILGLAACWGLVWNALDPQGVALGQSIPSRASTDPSYIDHATAARLWRDSRTTVFVDVRNLAGWRNGHIPGAVHLPGNRLGEALDRLGSRLGLTDDLVLYCDGPHCDVARHTRVRLQGLGYRRVRVYEGGWESWYASGLQRAQGDR